MADLAGKRIVVGVCGGIAAYKAVEVIRRLVDAGAHVIPVMTKGAEHFIGRTTLSALASEPVQTSLWDEASPIPHTKLGQGADLVLIAPATARLLGAYANGLSTDLMTNVLIATRAPVIVCPAMHTEMWEHPAIQQNVATLALRGVHIVEPEAGRLAGGDSGKGRLASPDSIVAAVHRVLGPKDLAGVKVVVSAGGTREPIDPIRFIGNRSSGRQGFALAAAAASRGAQVHLVAANTDLPVIEGVTITSVETAEQMAAVLEYEFSECDALIMSAAVADAKVANYSKQKIKKEKLDVVSFSKNPDILKTLSEKKKPGQVIVGFAAETISGLAELQQRGEEKLVSKSLDLIYVNNVSDGAVFGSEKTKGLIIDKERNVIQVPEISKDTLSDILLDQLVSKLG